jgi:hypothetical protein
LIRGKEGLLGEAETHDSVYPPNEAFNRISYDLEPAFVELIVPILRTRSLGWSDLIARTKSADVLIAVTRFHVCV